MIKFIEDTHQYFLGDKELISVTTLMQKHKLSPNYSGVSSEVLKVKAERGSLIHKEIEEYIKYGEIGFTTELENFITYHNVNKLKVLASEIIVYNDIVAGTVDLVIDWNGNLIIADIKTTSTIHKEAVSWQLSIYAYLKGVLSEAKGQVFHFDRNGNLKVVNIPLKTVEQVERLLECERKGEIYKQELTVNNFYLVELAEAEAVIKAIENQKKEAEARAAQLREVLLNAMEENGVTSFENERIKLTYVAPSTRTTIDSTRLKKELPNVAKDFEKTTTTKASLRITLKEAQ